MHFREAHVLVRLAFFHFSAQRRTGVARVKLDTHINTMTAVNEARQAAVMTEAVEDKSTAHHRSLDSWSRKTTLLKKIDSARPRSSRRRQRGIASVEVRAIVHDMGAINFDADEIKQHQKSSEEAEMVESEWEPCVMTRRKIVRKVGNNGTTSYVYRSRYSRLVLIGVNMNRLLMEEKGARGVTYEKPKPRTRR